MTSRRRCATPDCPNVARSVGRKQDGTRKFGRLCNTCHKTRIDARRSGRPLADAADGVRAAAAGPVSPEVALSEAVRFLEARRWPERVRCPRCGTGSDSNSISPSPVAPDGRRACPSCQQTFDVLTGSNFDRDGYGADLIYRAWLAVEEGPAHGAGTRVQRALGIPYDRALWLAKQLTRARRVGWAEWLATPVERRAELLDDTVNLRILAMLAHRPRTASTLLAGFADDTIPNVPQLRDIGARLEGMVALHLAERVHDQADPPRYRLARPIGQDLERRLAEPWDLTDLSQIKRYLVEMEPRIRQDDPEMYRAAVLTLAFVFGPSWSLRGVCSFTGEDPWYARGCLKRLRRAGMWGGGQEQWLRIEWAEGDVLRGELAFWLDAAIAAGRISGHVDESGNRLYQHVSAEAA